MNCGLAKYGPKDLADTKDLAMSPIKGAVQPSRASTVAARVARGSFLNKGYHLVKAGVWAPKFLVSVRDGVYEQRELFVGFVYPLFCAEEKHPRYFIIEPCGQLPCAEVHQSRGCDSLASSRRAVAQVQFV